MVDNMVVQVSANIPASGATSSNVSDGASPDSSPAVSFTDLLQTVLSGINTGLGDIQGAANGGLPVGAFINSAGQKVSLNELMQKFFTNSGPNGGAAKDKSTSSNDSIPDILQEMMAQLQASQVSQVQPVIVVAPEQSTGSIESVALSAVMQKDLTYGIGSSSQNSIKAAVQSSGSTVQNAMNATMQNSGNSTQKAIKAAVQNAGNAAQDAMNVAAQNSGSAAQDAVNSATQTAGNAAQAAINSATQTAGNAAQAAINSATQTAGSAAQAAINSATQNSASSMQDAINAATQNSGSTAQATINSATQTAGNAAQAAINSATQTAGSTAQAAINAAVQNSGSTVQNVISVVMQKSGSTVQKAINSVAQNSGSTAQNSTNSAAQNAASSAQNSISSDVQNSGSTVRNALTEAVSSDLNIKELRVNVSSGNKPSSGDNTDNSLLSTVAVHQTTYSKEAEPAQETLPVSKLNELSDPIVKALGSGNGNLVIKLSPPDMGTIQIRLKMENGVLSADFKVDSSAVKDLFSGAIPQIKQSIEGAGIKTGNFFADLKEDSSSGSGRQQDTKQQQQQQRQQKEQKSSFFDFFA